MTGGGQKVLCLHNRYFRKKQADKMRGEDILKILQKITFKAGAVSSQMKHCCAQHCQRIKTCAQVQQGEPHKKGD